MISQHSKMKEIVQHYPNFERFLFDRFKIRLSTKHKLLSLENFNRSFALPPPQILFMEFQLSERTTVRRATPVDLKNWIESKKAGTLLDVRENWELEWGTLPGSRPLNGEVLKEAISQWPKDTPLALYCHFGVRSLDAAVYLADQGFKDVQVLDGGLEAWSLQIDPTFPRYPGHPC